MIHLSKKRTLSITTKNPGPAPHGAILPEYQAGLVATDDVRFWGIGKSGYAVSAQRLAAMVVQLLPANAVPPANFLSQFGQSIHDSAPLYSIFFRHQNA